MENDQVFKFGPFVLDPLAQTFSRDDQEIALAPKAFAVLLVLVRNAGCTVTKDEIFREVWPDVAVEDQNITLNIHLLRRALEEGTDNRRYIVTVARRGYRFAAPVAKEDRVAVSPALDEPPVTAKSKDGNSSVAHALGRNILSLTSLKSALAEDGWFLVISCTLYALLHALALFVEVAFQFNSYAASVIRAAPFVFAWVWTTSLAGLIACRVLTSTRRAYSLPLPISVFVASEVILYLSTGSILPNAPITQSVHHAYPAHGAYFKSICYFFPLAVIFLVMPYHFVIAARTQIRLGSAGQIRNLLTGEKLGTAPEGTVFLRLAWLGVMLTVAAVASVVATAYLVDNLIQTEYTSMFTQLVQWRLVVYFSLGAICLMWYSRSLNAIKIASLKEMV